MARFALDSSCMVAAVCSWHDHHERAVAAINQRLDTRQTMIVPAHALVESYAVLTRLPPPHRLSAADAGEVLDTSFARGRTVIGLDGGEYVDLVRAAADAAIAGGPVCDVVIARSAAKGRASSLLTFNDSHFRAIGMVEFDIVVP